MTGRVVNYGSLNLDYVYALEHFVKAGETVSCSNMQVFFGGKGLNQSVALARAGAVTVHAGLIGAEGGALRNLLAENGVNTNFVKRVDAPNGHAIIQVDKSGQNSIIVFGGANRTQTAEFINEVSETIKPGDIVLTQNETGLTDEFVRLSKKKGAVIALNPSPIDSWLLTSFPFDLVDIFILNETEGQALTGKTEPDAIIAALQENFPGSVNILTLGEKGAVYFGPEGKIFQPAIPAVPVDTTAAGDTFTGYFLAGCAAGKPARECLTAAAAAASLAVSVKGAAESIPRKENVRV